MHQYIIPLSTDHYPERLIYRTKSEMRRLFTSQAPVISTLLIRGLDVEYRLEFSLGAQAGISVYLLLSDRSHDQ
mgnify:FL=1